MRLVDTFSGIGAFHIGVKDACKELGLPFECVSAVEWDKGAQGVYKKNFPDVPILGDITKIDIGALPQHNILTGGFPCQSFSQAGLEGGFNDVRGTLFFNLVEILRTHKPEYFIFENVDNITKHDGGNTFKVIIDTLERLDYSVSYKVLSPHEFGIPQSRKRVFIVGSLHSAPFFFPTPTNLPCSIEDVLDDVADTRLFIKDKFIGIPNHRLGKPAGNDINKIPKYFRNKLPITNRWEALQIAYNEGGWIQKPFKQNAIRTLSSVKGDMPNYSGRQRDRVFSIKGISPSLICSNPVNIIDQYGNWRTLSYKECSKLQSFPDSYKHHSNSNVATRQLGNSVNCELVKLIVKELLRGNG